MHVEIAVEQIQSYGQAVGREVFETCEFIGVIKYIGRQRGKKVHAVRRTEVKKFLGGTNDSSIRTEVCKALGWNPKSNKHPIKTHAWQAAALALTVLRLRSVDTEPTEEELSFDE